MTREQLAILDKLASRAVSWMSEDAIDTYYNNYPSFYEYYLLNYAGSEEDSKLPKP